MKVIGKLRKSKKAVSTIIGTMLFIMIFFSAFFTMLYVTSTTSQLEQQRVHENVVITSAYLDRNKQLALNVTNYGSVTSHLTRLWIINMTDNDHDNFEFDYYLGPGEAISNVTSVKLTSGKTYAIRIATELGNIVSYNLASRLRARISLYAPSSVQVAYNTTVFMTVTNNDTSNNNIYDLVPTLTISPSSGVELKEGPTPVSISLLPTGNTVLFRWIYQVTGAALSFTYNGSFVGAPKGNYVTATSHVTTGVAVSAAVPVTSMEVLGAVPGPADITVNTRSYCGVIVSNPMDRNVTVYCVAITCTAARIHKAGRVTGINPSTGWTCENPTSTSSVVQWKSIVGQILPSRSVFNFTCTAEHVDEIVEAPIQIESLTSEGKYVKTYVITQAGTYPCMNLFYTRVPANPTANWEYVIPNVRGGTMKTYNVTLYNSSGNALGSNTSLYILIPCGWRNVTAASGQASGYWGTPSIATNPDTSTGIRVTSTATTLPAGASRVFQFSVISPTVSKTTLYRFPTVSFYPAFPYFISCATTETVVVVMP